MATNILMPALSPTMEEGKLARWLVKEGDTVKSGDILAEIETDKATMEFEAVDEGSIGKILVPEGSEGVKVNAPIAVLLGEGEKAGDVDIPAAMKNISEAVKAEAPTKAEAPKPEAAEAEAPKAEAKPAAPQAAAAPADDGARSSPRPWRAALPPQKGIDLVGPVGHRPARPHRQGRCRERQAGRQARCRRAQDRSSRRRHRLWRRCRMPSCSTSRTITKRFRTTPCARPSPSA